MNSSNSYEQQRELARQRVSAVMGEALDRVIFDILGNGGSTATSSDWENSTLKMAGIWEAQKRLVEAVRPAALPKLLRMPWPEKQTRTHRRKRINKKWRKRYGMVVDFSVDDGRCFIFPDVATGQQTVATYPNTYECLRQAIKSEWPGIPIGLT